MSATTGAPRVAAAFVSMLRRLGVEVPVGSTIAWYEALGAVGLEAREPVYWAGRATLVHDPGDVIAYDHAFGAFWDALPLLMDDAVAADSHLTLAIDDATAEDVDRDDEDGDDDGELITLRYSTQEVLGAKDFADYDADELAEAHRLMTQMIRVGGRRSSRRRIPSTRRRGRPDLRRTVRRAMRAGGEPIAQQFTTTGDRPRRVVFLLDVSGSMEIYARALIRFAQAAVAGRGRVEVFTLGTRLTRITRELSTRDPDRALRSATAAVADWNGGTRLGDALARFNDEWGQRGMARGATVVVLSDGWDRGSPAQMAEQMGRIARLAHRVIWVNPLKASPGYQPLAQGMAAALPHLDRFIEGHCLDSLGVLAALLSEERPRRGPAVVPISHAAVGS